MLSPGAIRTTVLLAVVGGVAPMAQAADSFVKVFPPCRIADTRATSPIQAGSGALAAGSPRNFQITGAVVGSTCNVPAVAVAVAINVGVSSPTQSGFITLWPAGSPFPGTSTINVVGNAQPLANGAIVPLAPGAEPRLRVIYGAPGGATADVFMDITGFFIAAGTCAVDADCPALENDCRSAACLAGVCGLGPNKSAGTGCSTDGGNTCDGTGRCVAPCIVDNDCRRLGGNCVSGFCQPECTVEADCPIPTSECQLATCASHRCAVTNLAQGTACATNFVYGAACSSSGTCRNHQCGVFQGSPDLGGCDPGFACVNNLCEPN